MVWVSHDLDQVNRIADHVVVVIGGAIAYTGATAAVAGSSDPRVLEFLAGENDAG